MNSFQRWLQAPQTALFRRALFQVHLWLGIGFGLYVLVISVSGSALLLKSPFYTWFEPKTLTPLDTAPLEGDHKTGPSRGHSWSDDRACIDGLGHDLRAQYVSRGGRLAGPGCQSDSRCPSGQHPPHGVASTRPRPHLGYIDLDHRNIRHRWICDFSRSEQPPTLIYSVRVSDRITPPWSPT